MARLASLLTVFLIQAPAVVQQPDADVVAVYRAVQDYVEAFYQMKPELIERSVHPALVKRGCWRPEGSREYSLPSLITYDELRELAAHWNEDHREDLTYSIEVRDVLDVTASAKLSAAWGVDHMQLMKRDGKWKIIHVLWQSHPPTQPVEAGSGG